MKKRVKHHIQHQDYVKVYLADDNGNTLNHFNGFILEQNDAFIQMIDFREFDYDGIVVIPKLAIDEIRLTDNERHLNYLLEKESIREAAFKRANSFDFKLSGYREMFDFLLEKQLPIIIECRYNDKDLFQLGPILKTTKKKVFIDYIDARGEYSLKSVKAMYDEITFFRIDCPYATIYHKYAKRVE